MAQTRKHASVLDKKSSFAFGKPGAKDLDDHAFILYMLPYIYAGAVIHTHSVNKIICSKYLPDTIFFHKFTFIT